VARGPNDERQKTALSTALTRALINNMVVGAVHQRATKKKLKVRKAVGYQAALKGKGRGKTEPSAFAKPHPAHARMRGGGDQGGRCPTPTTIHRERGRTSRRSGQFAAGESRASKKPEPYKGKGCPLRHRSGPPARKAKSFRGLGKIRKESGNRESGSRGKEERKKSPRPVSRVSGSRTMGSWGFGLWVFPCFPIPASRFLGFTMDAQKKQSDSRRTTPVFRVRKSIRGTGRQGPRLSVFRSKPAHLCPTHRRRKLGDASPRGFDEAKKGAKGGQGRQLEGRDRRRHQDRPRRRRPKASPLPPSTAGLIATNGRVESAGHRRGRKAGLKVYEPG